MVPSALFSCAALEDLVSDLRCAGREIRRSTGCTIIAVASVAVGIAAVTATFAVIEAVMLRPLPVRNPEQVVAFTTAADHGWEMWSYAAFARGQRTSGGLYDAAASSGGRSFSSARADGEPPVQVPVSLGWTGYFDVIGARVVFGRPFGASDAAAGQEPSRWSAMASGVGGSEARQTC